MLLTTSSRKARRSIGLTIAALAASIVVAAAGLLVAAPSYARAESSSLTINGNTFNAGLIISDQIFFASNAMSVDGIQSFLNGKVARCSAGATCLKDYHQDTYSIPADPMCSAIGGASNQSAAQIIYTVAQACGINPEVILVTLQKEQGLVTTTSPSLNAYRSAMGAGCPDSGSCDSNYYGFFNQVRYGAFKMKRYTQPAGTGPGTDYYTDYLAPYRVGSTTAVRYSPNCSGPAITIQNMATHVLYVYTPYQPEPDVLAGTVKAGDNCAAYGNYNFWRYFTSWFGSTVVAPGSTSFVTAAYNDVLGRTPSTDEVNYWDSRLAGGSSRVDVANGFNNSDEYRTARIKQAYTDALSRDADAPGLAYWLSQMQQGRLQPDDVYRTFLASNEMYQIKGGNTDAGYVTAIYQQILHRAPEADGLAYWTARLAAGNPRSDVANSLWFAPETGNVRVNDTYQLLLGHPAATSEQTYWANFAASYGQTAMRSTIMGSDEYFIRAGARFPTMTN